MSTFGAMRDRILNETNRPDLSTEAEEAIQSAIAHYSTRRFWFNTDVITDADATTADAEYVDLPATLLAIDSLQLDDGNGFYTLERWPNAKIEYWNEGAVASGAPYAFSEYQGQVRLSPIPAAIYDLKWFGLVELAALSADSDTNAWMVEAEELIRERAKAYVLINIVRDAEAKADARMLALQPRGQSCLSAMELAALRRLRSQTVKRTTRGMATASEV